MKNTESSTRTLEYRLNRFIEGAYDILTKNPELDGAGFDLIIIGEALKPRPQDQVVMTC